MITSELPVMGKVKRCGLFAETLRYAGGVPQLRFRLPMGYAICCSDDGRKLACLGRRVNVFDISSRQKISTTHPFPHPSHAAFSPDGKILVVKFTSGRIVVLDPATGNMMHDHKNQREGEGSEVLSSPDGHDLIDASWDGVIKVRKSFERTVVTQQQFEGEMIKRISHDSVRRTWLIEHRPKLRLGENWPRSPYLTLQKWPIGKRKPKVLTPDLDIIGSATLSPDASRVCFVCTRRRLGRWVQIARASDGNVLATSEEIRIGGTGCGLAWSSDGKYVGSVQSRRFVFYRASDLSVVGEVPCTYPSSICFLPGRDQVALGSWRVSALVEFADIMTGNAKIP